MQLRTWTHSADNSFGEFGCEGGKALTGGEHRVNFMLFFFFNIV